MRWMTGVSREAASPTSADRQDDSPRFAIMFRRTMSRPSQASQLAGKVHLFGHAYVRLVASPRVAIALIASALVWEFGVLFLKAGRTLFWFDELLTFHVSALQPFSLLWRALQAGADGMPPGYYALVRFARMLPADPQVTLRLPSILGYILSLLGVYWFARKKMPAVTALTAFFLIALSPFREFALDARPYSLLVGFLAVSAAIWQRIDQKRFMTLLFAIFLTLAVSSHYLAVVAILCFGIAELAWTLLSRRIRWRVWAACLFAAFPFLLGLPTLMHFREIFGKNFWSQPTWGLTFSTYRSYLGFDSMLALVLVLLLGIVVGGSLLRTLRNHEESTDSDFSPPEMCLVGSFLFYPAFLVLLTKLLGSGYTPRYGWPGILGLALASAYLFHAVRSRSSSAHLLGALLIAFAVQGAVDLKWLSRAGPAGVDARWTRLAAISRTEPAIPVVVGSGHTYLEAAEYAPPQLRARLVRIVDADISTRLIGSDSNDKVTRLLAQFVPLRVEDLASFQAAHQRFILCSGDVAHDWFTQYLVETGYHLKLLAKDAGNSLYMVRR